MDPAKIFSLNGRLLQAVPDQAGRNLLLRRLESFLTSRRRGRLRLPKYFPREVQRISELPKRWIRTFVYWVKPSTSIDQRLPKHLFDHIARNYPGMVWNSPSETLQHMANVVGTLRLRKTDWPGISRDRWPSTPSMSELLAMSRRGYLVRGLDRTNFAIKNCLTRKALSDNIRLASRVVAYNVVGIRSSCLIPEKFLSWFRYRSGFLILTVRYNMPAGLVRSLLAHWQKCPFNLWLKENCRLKNFLRRHSPTDFIGDDVVSVPDDLSSVASYGTEPEHHYGCLGGPVPTRTEPHGEGNPSPHLSVKPLTAEDFEEMGEEFTEFFNRLPN